MTIWTLGSSIKYWKYVYKVFEVDCYHNRIQGSSKGLSLSNIDTHIHSFINIGWTSYLLFGNHFLF